VFTGVLPATSVNATHWGDSRRRDTFEGQTAYHGDVVTWLTQLTQGRFYPFQRNQARRVSTEVVLPRVRAYTQTAQRRDGRVIHLPDPFCVGSQATTAVHPERVNTRGKLRFIDLPVIGTDTARLADVHAE
jgi:hypothetical protein